MGLDPGFDALYLIEQDPVKVEALLELAGGDRRVSVRQGDANQIVQSLCRQSDWIKERKRGVIFLDPYGMEVSWETVVAIGKTEALDCWYFFPLSGLYRNSPRDPKKLDATKIDAINRVFGTDRWRHEWYVTSETQADFFDNPAIEERSVTVDQIEIWIQRRLRDAFKGAVLAPLRLYHPGGAPMASLFFAISNSNPRAIALASRIAGHILKVGISSQKRPR